MNAAPIDIDKTLAMPFAALKDFLDEKVDQYNRVGFIANDPIVIPHQFQQKQDIEIAGFFAAILAWGQRKTIINKCNNLLDRMDRQPYQFILHHSAHELRQLSNFVHRTFNEVDLLYFVRFLQQHYQTSRTLETAFIPNAQQYRADYMDFGNANDEQGNSSTTCYSGDLAQGNFCVEKALNYFRTYFFSLSDYPQRTVKHISSPQTKATCKRLNMFLRWMVRSDDRDVDFGLWQTIKSSQLICPCDVHVDRVGRALGLLTRKQNDWQAAIELTQALRQFDAKDPVKYDFALFGLGVEGVI
jgi:uncharacterized protein (TIGR02757 family)